MKKTFLIIVIALLSVSAFGQTKVRNGLEVGDSRVSGSHIETIDSVTVVSGRQTNYADGDTLDPVFNAGSLATSVAEADSADWMNKYTLDDELEAVQLIGGDILSEPVLCKMSEATVASTALTSGYFYVYAHVLRKDTTITGVRAISSASSGTTISHPHVPTTDSTSSFALYTLSGTTLTKVAETTNDSTILETGNGSAITRAFVTPYAAKKGIIYVAYCGTWHGSGDGAYVAPEFYASQPLSSAMTGNVGIGANANKLAAYKTGVYKMPATIAMSDLTAGSNCKWIVTY